MDWWDWRVVRAHFARRLEAARDSRGLSQVTIAEAGGLKQNLISKLLANPNKGPSVETFLRALKGLGTTPSEFFAELEAGEPRAPAPGPLPPAPLPPLDDHTRTYATIGKQLVRVLGKVLDETTKRRRRPR